MKETYKKLPKSPLALYVKIYCKKADSSKNKKYVLMEATKSWVSLSKADKQYFCNVFKEYEKKVVQNFATYLQNAKPYMKKRFKGTRYKNHEDFSKTTQDVVLTSNICLPSTKDQVHEQDNESKCLSTFEYNEANNHHDPFISCNENVDMTSIQYVNEPDVARFVPEPMPPITSSRELFEIIQNNGNNTSQDLDWTQLSKSQKRQYQKAVVNIKNDYIKQYTTFLEQLTPKQLFQYYRSKF